MNRNRRVFVLDTNVFIEANRRYYAQSLCPGFWECLKHYCTEGHVLSIDRVRTEILINADDLSDWINRTQVELFVSTADPLIVNAFTEMMDWVQRNQQFQHQAKEEFASVADGWLAAYARVHNAVVVTHEALRPDARKRVPLPNVCRQFRVDWQDTFEMLSDLNVRFNWEPPA